MEQLILPKLKLKLKAIFEKIVLGNIVGNIPFSIIRDIKEIVELDTYKDNIQVYKKLDDSNVEKYDFPQDYPMRFPRDKAFESKYIYKVNNAYISTRTGVVWTKNNKVLLESVGSLGRVLGWGGVLVDLLMNRSKDTIRQSVIVCPDTGYYHWLLEVLPNILHLIKHIDGDFKIAIDKQSNKYLRTALKYILKDDYDSKVIVLEKPAKVKSVFISYYESQSGFVRKIDRNILREYFLSNKNSNKRKVYISRLKAPKRSIGNEQEVEQFLKSKGFDIVYAEHLNWLEQIELYNQSSFIIAPHGAGLSNTIWCNENTKILEIFPYDNLHFCFATLAKSNNLKYDYIVCEQDLNSSGKVNLDLLGEKVKKL